MLVTVAAVSNFRGAAAMSRPEDSMSQHSSSPALQSFLLASWMLCSLSLGGIDRDVHFRVEHSAVTYSQLSCQLQVSSLTGGHYRKVSLAKAESKPWIFRRLFKSISI